MIMKNSKIYFSILLIFFLIFLATSLLLKKSSKPKTRPNFSVVPTASSTYGYLKLQTVGKITRFPVGQPINLSVMADSGGENIVGWDLLIVYDTAAFDFVKASSNLPDFKTYSYKWPNHISITGIKLLQNQNPSVFKSTNVATLVFQPKKTGRFTLMLKDSLGKERSQLVNTATKKIFPQLNQLTIEIY